VAAGCQSIAFCSRLSERDLSPGAANSPAPAIDAGLFVVEWAREELNLRPHAFQAARIEERGPSGISRPGAPAGGAHRRRDRLPDLALDQRLAYRLLRGPTSARRYVVGAAGLQGA
jgi:hypothetical protein